MATKQSVLDALAAAAALTQQLADPATTPPPPPPVVGPFDNLELGYVRALGNYADPDPQFNANRLVASLIVEDNCLVAWPGGDMVLFPNGAGHGLSQQTNPRGFDVTGQKWVNLVPSTPASAMVAANVDTLYGRYKSTGEPTARHGYGLCHVIDDVMYVLAARGMADTANDLMYGTTWGGAIYKRDLRTGQVTYSDKWFSTQDHPTAVLPAGGKPLPWYFANQSFYHPPSARIVVIGIAGVNGSPRMWLYDPANDDIVDAGSVTLGGVTAGAGWLEYCPDTDRAYLFLNAYGTPNAIKVWEVTPNASDMTKTMVLPVAATGSAPVVPWSFRTVFRYDSVNKVLLGAMDQNLVYVFNPATKAWRAVAMNIELGSARTYLPGLGAAPHCAAMHSPSNTLVFTQLIGSPPQAETWAFRYDPSAVDVQRPALGFTLGTQSYPDLASVGPLVKSGDTLLVAPGTYYGDAFDFGTIANVTVKCSGGRARFVGGVASSKGTFVVGDGWTFDGIECVQVRGNQANEAGIRMNGNGLTVRNFYFADSNNGVLTSGGGNVLFEDGVSERNGDGSGQSHNFYIGKHANATWNRVRSDDANVGHLFKSRAAVTTLNDCTGYEGHASRSVDVPEGGVLRMSGSAPGAQWMKQDALTNNSNMVGYAMELGGKPPTWPVNEIHIDANTVLYNARVGGTVLLVLAGFPVSVIDNQAKSGPDPAP